MRTRILPLPTFRRRIARRTRARLLARHMLRLLTQGTTATAPALAQARRMSAPLLSRIALMLLRASPPSQRGHAATTQPH